MTNLPNLNLDEVEVPFLKLVEIQLDNVKAFESQTFSFEDDSGIKPFMCYHGPNGCGKTTLLDCIQLLFANFKGYKDDRLKNQLSKLVRKVKNDVSTVYDDKKKFRILAKFKSSLGNYEVEIDKSGFIQDHPEEIREVASRLCFNARFDQELDLFQLNRNKWNDFKDLFEAVTGYEIEETETIFDQSADPVQEKILKQYVLGFWVKKPHETISHKQCSAGEKKTIKCFSTLLNKEITPPIIIVDNVEMHVESGRHIELIDSMKRCFTESQIFCSTHSYHISRNYPYKTQLFDMRLLKANDLVKNEPWRLALYDELFDTIVQLKGLKNSKNKDCLINNGLHLLESLYTFENKETLKKVFTEFFIEASKAFVNNLVG